MAGDGWEIIEADSFERGIAQCGGHAVVEERIAVVKHGLSRDPFGYLETQLAGIWLAKTKVRWEGSEIVPAYAVRYRISPESRTVTLLHIEWAAPEDDLWDDGWDDIPRP